MRRIYVPELSAHVYHRGNNRMVIFTDDEDRVVFLRILEAAAEWYRTSVHAFVLMSTHFHAIATPDNERSLAGTMKQVGERYVRYFNRKHKRTGTLWEGPYRAKHITDERQWLICLRYIEQNQVRARMVPSPDAYPWSSYRVHGLGLAPGWLVLHPVYLGLGSTDEERQAAYRAICSELLPEPDLVCIRNNWMTPQSDLVCAAV